MKKGLKKLVFFFFLVACIMIIQEKEVNAASAGNTYVRQFDGSDVNVYKQESKAPIPEMSATQYNDWIFAGWYTNEACTTAMTTEPSTGTIYYAKFVPSEILNVKCQVSAGVDSTSDSSDMRLVSSVDSLQYEEVGFEVSYNGGKTIKISSSTVYRRIQAAKGGVAYAYSPDIFELDSEYFITATLKNIANKNFYKGFYIKAYWITLDGTTVYGTSRYARVEDSYLNIANVPVRVVAEATLATGEERTVAVTYDATKFAYADNIEATLKDEVASNSPGYANGSAFGSITISNSVVDNVGTITITGTTTNAASLHGEVAHLRLKANNVTNLPRKNTFQVAYTGTEAVVAVDSVFDYLSTTYSFGDREWFANNTSATEFVIATPNELAGLATLVNDGTFQTQTIYLAADIELNQGKATEWAKGTNTEGLFQWTPIGITGVPFKGTFDGQGHTITGMYAVKPALSTNSSAGLFGYVKGAQIKNISLTNGLAKMEQRVGSFAASTDSSEFINLYSDVIVSGTSSNVGGLIGELTYGGGLTNCWFDGTVSGSTYVGGLVGRTCAGDIKITGCLNSGMVSSTGLNCGGFIGFSQNYDGTAVTLSNSLNVGSVASTDIVKTGTLIGNVEGKLYVDNNTVHTTQSELTYAFAWFPGTLYDIDKNVVANAGNNNRNLYVPFSVVTDISGDKAYQNTGLDFENTWVARIGDTPVLNQWCESGAIYKYDTEWVGTGAENDPYIIKTANELYGLAQKVNAGETFAGKFIKLGANITINNGSASAWEEDAPKYNWIPIGISGKPFKGTFDGQGYSIKGMYAVEPALNSNSSVGLFGYVDSAVIKNVHLINGYAQMEQRVGSFAASSITTEFMNLYSNVIVNGTSSNVGGLVGELTYGGGFTNCWFDGTVSGSTYVGGLAGRTCAGDIKITGCLNSGAVSSTGLNCGGFVGFSQLFDGTAVTLTNSLNVGSVTSPDIVKTGALIGNVEGSLYVDKNSVHTVQSGLNYAFAWFAATLYDIDKNVIANTGNENRNQYVPFNAEADLIGANGYLNTGLTFDRPELPTPTEGAWVAREGDYPALKIFVGKGDRMELVGDNMYRADTSWYNTTDTEFTISTTEELVGLSSLVSAGTSFEGKTVKIGQDIVINKGDAKEWAEGTNTQDLFPWTPIGINGKPFKGIFDGQGHSITGMYAVNPARDTNSSAGLFGYVNSAVIKNIRLTNGFASMEQRVGSFAANSETTEFINLYSNVIVNGTGSNIGGIVGELTYGGGLTNCWFAGTVSGSTYVGGLAGRTCAGDIKITGCFNSGTVSSTGLNCGGFVGFSQLYDGTAVTLTNSLNVGSVSSPNIERTGALIGNVEGSLYVDKNSVHTVQTGLNYAFAWFAATLYDIDKNVIANTGNENRNKYVAFTSEENLKGANGYLNTGLTFDRPELPTPTEGVWVMREDTYPALKMFVDEEDRMELFGINTYRADTSWYNTTDTEFVINTVEELVGLSSLVSAGTSFESKTVKLGKDLVINKGDAKEWAAGTNTQDLFPWEPIGISGKQFKGIFDGQGHSIAGMYAINPGLSTNSSTGLFGYVKNAKIQNISLLNGFASMEHRVGSFAANSESSEFINLYSNVIVKGTGNNIGGLVGELTYGGGFANCWYDGTVTGGTYTGGLVGRTCVGDIKISGCLNSGTVSGTTNVGGFIGFSQEYQGTHVTLSNSINTGSVSGGNAGTTGALTGTVQGYLYVDKNSVHTVQAGPSYAFASVSATLYDNDKNVITENKEQYISSTAISALYDLKAYNIVDRESWTVRVDSYPIPSVFANGDYANAAKVGSDYAIDVEFVGSGTAEDPSEISTAAELYGLALLSQTDSYTGIVFELTDDITINPVTIDTSVADEIYYDWLPIGNGDYPFAGTFIGNGYTISGLYKARETEKDLGLFARTTVDAVVENFTLTNTYFHWLNGTSDAARMGAIAGRGGGTFTNIHSSAIVTSSWYGSGGILGEANSNTTITNCWYDGFVKGLRADGSSYTGGMIGLASGGDVAIKHSLVSGSASAWKNVGGFIGGAKGTIQVTLEDNLFSGTILDGGSGYAGQFIGSVEGASTTTSATISKCFGVSDDIAKDIGALVSGPAITGKAGSSVKADRLIGYTGTSNGLDFAKYWVLTKNSTPALKTFTAAEDVYDGSGINALLQLTYWDSITIANAEDKGAGNYMITIEDAVLGAEDGSTAKSYYGYLAALGANGFAAYGNDNGLNSEGVYNAIYTKGTEWVVNVTYISYKENDSVTPKIYITFNTGQPLSTHLKATNVASVNYSAADGYSVAHDKVTYHMLESSYAGFGAGSYIMQLKNGHFIIIDGGILDDVAYLFEYLESLAVDENGNKLKPIVEAWIFSHQHSDHMGPMLGIMKDVNSYKNRIYVEGFYYNEPNGDIVETYAKDSYSLVQALKNCAAHVLTTTEGKAPQVYRIQTGQRYTFDGVEMDVMLSQELLTVADYEATYNKNNSYQQDSFNDTSTWCMFTIGEGNDAQKLLSSGDGSYSGKKYVCDMYSSSYMTVDVFTALHHGLNTNMSQYMVLSNRYESVTQEAFSQKCTVEGVVLYSYKYDMTEENQTLNNNNVYAVNWKYAKLNDSFITYLEEKSSTFATGIPVLKNGITTNRNYLYFGEGASVLTFNGKTATNPITAEVLPTYDFTE